MGDSLPVIAVENIGGVLEELELAFFDIPFQNSDFQTKAFVVAAQQTPGRAYRAVGLQMFSKIEAIREHKFQVQMRGIDKEEKLEKMEDSATSEFDRRRLRLELAHAESGARYAEKLLNDAVHELNILYAEFNRLPKYTRAQFEAEEPAHFRAKLARQLTSAGPKEALLNMTEDLPSMDLRIGNALSEMKRLGLLGENDAPIQS